MNAGGCEQLKTDDDFMKFLDSLVDMKLRDTALDQQATNDLAERCLEKFDDPEADLECRAISLYTVLAQITAGNASMLVHVPEICQRLQSGSVLTQPTAGAGAEHFHHQVVNAISIILDVSPEKLVDESFGPVMHYLVQLVSCEQVEIAVAACKFWAKYAGMASNATIRRYWVSPLVPEISSLIGALMDQMSCRPEYAEHVEQFGSHCFDPAGDKSAPSDVESLANLRNLAAAAFENVAEVYPPEMVCATFRPVFENTYFTFFSKLKKELFLRFLEMTCQKTLSKFQVASLHTLCALKQQTITYTYNII